MGKIVKPIASVASGILAPITGGALGDTLFGAKDPGTAASLVNTNSAEAQRYSKEAMDKYGGMLNQNSDQIVNNQITGMENQARASVQDQERKARDMVAQRGLGGSASGINAILSQSQGLGDKIGEIRASQPGLLQQMKQQNLNFASSGIGNMMNAQNGGMIYNKEVASQGRMGGGIAPILMQGGKMAMSGGA